MDINSIVKNVMGKSLLVLDKHSPEILMVVGVTGIVGSTILACRATMKCEETLYRAQEKFEKIDECWDKVKEGEIFLDDYSKEDRNRDLVIAYIQTAVDFIKLYGPAVTLGVASISCIVGAHGIMRKRNVALMAAYKAIEEGFSVYRKRVVGELGEEKDYIFRHGLVQETVTEKETDENGKTVSVKKQRLVTNPDGLSVYSRYFDETCKEWTKTPEYNMMFLRAQQTYFNQMLTARGHVFLNEVYDALGIPRSQAGAVVGWVLGAGDNFIDFGIYEDRSKEFVNGYERCVLLDFNVDGVIYDLI